MAEKPEGGKPSDFFLGVVDLFAILLPGALLTILVRAFLTNGGRFDDLICHMPKEGVADWALFLVESYILGHFIFALGSFLLDGVYDVTYSEWFHKNKNKKLIDSVNDRLKGLLPSSLVNKQEDSIEGGPLAWSSSFVRVQSAAAGVEIDRAEADSKFFRSLATLQLLSWPLFLYGATGPWWMGWKPLYAVVFAVLVVLLILPKSEGVKDGLRYKEKPQLDNLTAEQKKQAEKGEKFELTAEQKKQSEKAEKAERERKLSNSRFYALLLGVISFWLAGMAGHAVLPTEPDNWIVRGIPWIIPYGILFLSVWRFMNMRLRRTKLTYEFFLVLSSPLPSDKSPVLVLSETNRTTL